MYQYLIDAIAWLISMLYIPFAWLLDALFYLLKGVAWLILDGLLTAVLVVIQGINYSSVVFQWAAGYALIPSQAVYVMQSIGFPQFVTIIASAYALRFLLNIIPSWATRV